MAAVPDVYIWALKRKKTGFGNVTSLQLLTHLWTSYGTITQKELVVDDNQTRIQLPWSPPTLIEELFNQLKEGITILELFNNSCHVLTYSIVAILGVNLSVCLP
jgi:hypothetical protein